MFLRIGPRLFRTGLLALGTAILVRVTAASLPVSVSVVAVPPMVVAPVVFLLNPAMLESRLRHRHFRHLVGETVGEVESLWFEDPT